MKKLKKVIKGFLDEKVGYISPSWGVISPGAEYVSFDIFDTLISRKTGKPVQLFEYMEKQLCMPGFSEKRIKAERDARNKSQNGEVTLKEIYQSFEGVSPDKAEELCRKELEAELSVCRFNKRLKKLYRQCIENKKVILTSDMYLTSEMMEKLLESCGIRGYERLFISCEAGVSKRSGELYRYVLSELGISPKQLVHIGNDIMTDDICACLKGIRAVKVRTMPYRRLQSLKKNVLRGGNNENRTSHLRH
ncbi:MAG: hypothetical protein IJ555_06715 [Ruminococcus sp.]|nr:hypothetical protein [Ruminococcus sp.]